ncbi:MAG: MFS transporter [Ferruginibacter sp.]
MKKIISPPQVVAIALCLVTLAVNISMPLFRVYAAAAGLNNGQTSLVLAAYITGMLPCYVFLGGISDKLGRKPVIIASLLCALASTIVINLFPNVHALIISRLLQGIALGLSMGCGTAYISELMTGNNAASRSANMASLATSIGFGGGALATAIVLLNHFTLVPVTYQVLISVTIAGLLLTFFLPPIKPIGGSLIRLPYFPKGSFEINISIAICWAATGVVIAIIPAQLAKFGLTPYAGFCLVLVNWSGALLQPFIRKMNAMLSVKIGAILIPAGFALLITGCYTGILWIILLGTFVIGTAAYGFSYVGGLNLISNLGGIQKARAVSGYMFVGYIGFGIPAIFLGYLADHSGIINSLLVFETVIILLSAYLLIKLNRRK